MSFFNKSVLVSLATMSSISFSAAFAESYPISSKLEVIASPKFSRGACPAALLLTGVGISYEGGYTTNGKVNFGAIATGLTFVESTENTVTWGADLLPKYAGCVANAQWGDEESPLTIEFVGGQVFMKLDVSSIYADVKITNQNIEKSSAVFSYSIAD